MWLNRALRNYSLITKIISVFEAKSYGMKKRHKKYDSFAELTMIQHSIGKSLHNGMILH